MVRALPLFIETMVHNRVQETTPMDLRLRQVKIKLSTSITYCFKIYCNVAIPHTPQYFSLHIVMSYPDHGFDAFLVIPCFIGYMSTPYIRLHLMPLKKAKRTHC
jgi:hypothetical protein